VAISKSGRLFTNYPLWEGPHLHSLVEVLPGNTVKPYPNARMNEWKEGDEGRDKWVCVQAVYIDDKDNMWVVDPASPGMKAVYRNSHKLVKINLERNEVERIYYFEGAAGEGSYINDVRVDTEKGFAYLTNSNEGGILVVNTETGTIRQVLQGQPSVQSDPEFTFTIDGKELEKEGEPVKMHSDGLALTPDGKWLYFKPLTDNKLYRLRTEFLQDEDLTSGELAQWVEDLGTFCTSDGMIFGADKNLYLGDLQRSSIVKVDPDHKQVEILQDDRLLWPDSYAVSDDGWLYISCSQIHKQPQYNEGTNRRTLPYTIYRLKIGGTST
jgi:sugar lactone lactonase YvrE